MSVFPGPPPPHSKICNISAPPGLWVGCHCEMFGFIWGCFVCGVDIGKLLWGFPQFPNVDVFLPLRNHDNQHITIVDTPSTHEEGKINKDFRKNKETWKIKHNKYFLPFAINLKILNQKYSITLYATCHNLFRTQCCMQYKLPRISRHGEK